MKFSSLTHLMSAGVGIKYVYLGHKLCKTAETPEEKAAAAAFRRTQIGTYVLVSILFPIMAVFVVWAVMGLESSPKRIGTVQADGQIRYIHNTPRFISQEALGVEQWELEPGEKVYVYADSVTDEVTYGLPVRVVEERDNLRFGILFGWMGFTIVALLFYALVICRLTSFGRAWAEYCAALTQQEQEPFTPRQNLVINVVAAVLAVVILSPQIMGIIGNIQHMKEINERSELIASAGEAAEKASEMIEELDNMDITVDVQDAEDAANEIRDIVDHLNQSSSTEAPSVEVSETLTENPDVSETTETMAGLQSAEDAANQIKDILGNLNSGNDSNP